MADAETLSGVSESLARNLLVHSPLPRAEWEKRLSSDFGQRVSAWNTLFNAGIPWSSELIPRLLVYISSRPVDIRSLLRRISADGSETEWSTGHWDACRTLERRHAVERCLYDGEFADVARVQLEVRRAQRMAALGKMVLDVLGLSFSAEIASCQQRANSALTRLLCSLHSCVPWSPRESTMHSLCRTWKANGTWSAPPWSAVWEGKRYVDWTGGGLQVPPTPQWIIDRFGEIEGTPVEGALRRMLQTPVGASAAVRWCVEPTWNATMWWDRLDALADADPRLRDPQELPRLSPSSV